MSKCTDDEVPKINVQSFPSSYGSMVMPVPNWIHELLLTAGNLMALKCFEQLFKIHICTSLSAKGDFCTWLQQIYGWSHHPDNALVHHSHTSREKRTPLWECYLVITDQNLTPFNTNVLNCVSSHQTKNEAWRSGAWYHYVQLDHGLLNHRQTTPNFFSQDSWTQVVPQGCVFTPLLPSLFMHDCITKYSSNNIFQYADWWHQSFWLRHHCLGSQGVLRIAKIITVNRWQPYKTSTRHNAWAKQTSSGTQSVFQIAVWHTLLE